MSVNPVTSRASFKVVPALPIFSICSGVYLSTLSTSSSGVPEANFAACPGISIRPPSNEPRRELLSSASARFSSEVSLSLSLPFGAMLRSSKNEYKSNLTRLRTSLAGHDTYWLRGSCCYYNGGNNLTAEHETKQRRNR